MKKSLLLFLLLPTLLMAQQPGFDIRGQVSGLANSPVKITTSQKEAVMIAMDSSKGGAFHLKGSVPEPGLYFLMMGNEQPQYIYLDNSNISVSGSVSDIKNLKIQGSSSHVDFVEFNRVFNPIMAELNALAAQINSESNEAKHNVLTAQYDSVLLVLSKQTNQFVAARPTSYVSPFLIWVTSQVTPVNVMEDHYNLLSDSLRNHSQIGKSLGEFIAYNKVGAVGTDAMDFTQNDVNGKPVSLSSFKGKYVLVDFWASWCGPCRRENPNVVKTYQKFKDKNFTILGVSLDQQKEAWVKAIEKDGLTWNHVSDLQYWDNAVAKMYRIASIPGNFLVDPQGKIIAKDLHGPELEQTLVKFLGTAEKPAAPKSKAPKGNTTSNRG